MGNFFYTFEHSFLTKYPRSFFFHEVVNSTLFESPGLRINLYSLHSAHNECVLLKILEEKHYKDFPYIYRRTTRYIGEDVEFVCRFSAKNVFSKETFWTLDGRRIINMNRVFYHVMNGNFNSETNMTDVTSTLKVYMLRASDFGEYKCISTWPHETIWNVYQMELTIAVYDLHRIHKSIEVVYKTVGDLISTDSFFLYHTFLDVYDVFFEYTVNGQNIGEVCPGFNDHTCSIGAAFLNRFRDIEADHYPFLAMKEYSGEIKKAVTSFCLCGRAFGVHKVTFVRKIKSKNGNMVWVDAENPFVFVVLPQANLSLFRVFNDTYLYKEIEDLLISEANETIIERKFNEQIKFIDAQERNVLRFANIMQSIIFSLSSIVSIILLNLIVKFCCVLFIRIPALKYIHHLPITHETQNNSQMIDFPYDVFLSHSKDEDSFVKNILLPFLEGHCKQRACFPERDFVPGELETQQYTYHISRSRKIIVLLSSGYRNDSFCHNFQLERIILPMLYEQKLLNAQVLFLLLDKGALFPNTLRWDLEAEKIDWRTHLPEKSKLLNVKLWLETGRVQ